MEEYYAAVDIGGTKITASLASREGIRAKLYQNTRLEGDNYTIPEQVDFLIGSACDYAGIGKESIIGVGVSSCGPFCKKGKYNVLVASNLCGGLARQRGIIPNDWMEIPLESRMSGIYSNIIILNDCVSAVVAERLFGAGKGEDNLVYITWSTGVGAGAFVDGVLLKGKNGNAPHFGHSYIAEDGPLCGCGNRGDLESLCSGSSIARDYGYNVRTEEVFNLYRDGDRKAVEIVDRAARNFARGLASINAILDTRVFVIGGSVFMNNPEILMPLIGKEFYKSFPALSQGVEIRKSELNSYLGDVAALSLVMPGDWISEWQDKGPWKHAPDALRID